MTIITIGIDLAKNIFAVHGVNESGKPELVKSRVSRDQLLPTGIRARFDGPIAVPRAAGGVW